MKTVVTHTQGKIFVACLPEDGYDLQIGLPKMIAFGNIFDYQEFNAAYEYVKASRDEWGYTGMTPPAKPFYRIPDVFPMVFIGLPEANGVSVNGDFFPNHVCERIIKAAAKHLN